MMGKDIYIKTILSERFQLGDSQIKRFLLTCDESNIDHITSKLQLLESSGVLSEILVEEGTSIFDSPLFRCTLEELAFAIQIPEMMQFSKSQKQKYNKDVLYWSRYTDMRNTVLPVLEKLCDKEVAAGILKNLYISSYTTVCEKSIIEICEYFLNYTDAHHLLNSYLSENWYFVFSIYSDPISALQIIDGAFQHDHVIEVYTDAIDWNKIGYLKWEPSIIQHIQKSWAYDVMEKAKNKFSDYLRK